MLVLLSRTPAAIYYESTQGVPYKDYKGDKKGYVYSAFISVPEFPDNYKPEDEYFTTVDEKFNYVFKTIDDVKSYWRELFTEDMVNKNMFVYSLQNNKIELLRYSENNELMLFHEENRATDTLIWDMSSFSKDDDTHATVTVNYLCSWLPVTTKETVLFVKENNVWKVSGGTLFGYFYGENLVNDPTLVPETSDTSATVIPALTVAALISVALPVCIMRKRRRFA